MPFEAFRFVAAGKALTADPCQSRPCQNRGECLQLRYGRFRCECTGTGFYGDNCETGEFTSKCTILVTSFPQSNFTLHYFSFFERSQICLAGYMEKTGTSRY